MNSDDANGIENELANIFNALASPEMGDALKALVRIADALEVIAEQGPGTS